MHVLTRLTVCEMQCDYFGFVVKEKKAKCTCLGVVSWRDSRDVSGRAHGHHHALLCLIGVPAFGGKCKGRKAGQGKEGSEKERSA